MHLKRFLFVLIVVICSSVNLSAQVRKLDTSMQIGKVGYKIYCTNKNAEKNNVSVKPIGFASDAREVNVEVKGRLSKGEIDDLNGDGFPDLVLYVYNGAGGVYGNVFAIASDKNQSMRPIMFPDLVEDKKLNAGYMGHDEFMLMEGTLIRRFPVYNTTDSAHIEPTGVIRGIQYNAVNGEGGQTKFKVIRSFESQK